MPGSELQLAADQVELRLLGRVEVRRRIVGPLEVGARVRQAPIQPQPIEVLPDVVMEPDGREVAGSRVAAPGQAGHPSEGRRTRRAAAELQTEAEEAAEVGRAEAAEIKGLASLDGRADVAIDVDVAAEIGLGERVGARRQDQPGDGIGSVDPDAGARRGIGRQSRFPSAVRVAVELDRQPMLVANRLGEDRHDRAGEGRPAIGDGAARRSRRDRRRRRGLGLRLGWRVDRHRGRLDQRRGAVGSFAFAWTIWAVPPAGRMVDSWPSSQATR